MNDEKPTFEEAWEAGYKAGHKDATDGYAHHSRPPPHVTHIHKVEIKINSNQDPSRIAREVKNVLSGEARKPKK